MVFFRHVDTEKMAISELKRYKLKMQILSLLYQKNLRSSSTLSKLTNVSLPTVRLILDELIEEKVVEIRGVGDSAGGRKPWIYSLSGDAFFILAVELGHHSAKAVVYNSHNAEVSRIIRFETNINDPRMEESVEAALTILLTETAVPREKIIAIGLSMPGLIDSVKGINKTIRKADQRDVVGRFTRYFQIKTYIENDARMQALGEYTFGAAHRTRNAMIINWDWGLGLGMILEGNIFNGTNGSAGEFSHIRIDEEGDLCECGKKGCLQSMAGAGKLVSMAREELKAGAVSQLSQRDLSNPDSLKPDDIIECAKKGDEFSITLLSKLSSRLAWGLAILIQLLNPELIVLSGPMLKANQYVLIPIQQALHKYCLESILENVRIELSQMDESAGLKGVAVMVFQRLLSDTSLAVRN